ncbi:MAG: sigma factor [Trebonia sp.]
MRDSGLAAVYDRYADHIYTYCRFLLREPADAVDAVEDTFLVAVERLPGPPDDEWLRPWLFAVARNACLSRLKSGQAATALDETGGAAVTGRDADRALLRAALRGLTPAERDVIGMLWHGLDIAEVALVLGIDRDAALARFSQARDRLELCAVTLVVVRAGRQSCPGLSALLGDWDGRLTVALARKLSRHVDHCPDCGAQRREELRPSLLLSLTPGALLGAAVTDEALRRAAVPTRMLRRQALSAAADSSPEGAAVRGMACRHQGSFRENGFPKPLETEVQGGLRGPRGRIGLAAAAVVVIAAVGVAFASGGGQPSGAAGAGAGLDGRTQQSGGASVNTVGGTQPTGSRSPGVSPSASPLSSPSASPTPAPTPTPTPETTSASPSAPPSPSAKATSAKPSPHVTATLSVPSEVTLRQVQGQWPRQWQGSLTVTVSGGSLSWSLSGDQGLSFSQRSGTASATIAITGQGRGDFGPITVSAGGRTYTVDVNTHGGW